MSDRRRRHFAVDRLSEEGQAVVRQGQAGNWTLAHIVGEVKRQTGEEISDTAVHRWMADRQLQEQIAETQAGIEVAVELVSRVADDRFIRALNQTLKTKLLQRDAELEKLSAVELMGHVRAMERLELEHAKVAIDEQRAKVERAKIPIEEKKAEAALTVADARLKQIDHIIAQATTVRQKLEGAAAAATDGKVPAEVLSEAVRALYGIEVAQGAGDAP
jgi:hypothetical protein